MLIEIKYGKKTYYSSSSYYKKPWQIFSDSTEFKDGWEFPGGKIEEGEKAEEALIREIKEELKVAIRVEDYLITVDHSYNSFDMTMHCYVCTLLDDHLKLTVHEAAKWLTVDQLDSVDWLEADVEVVETLKKL